MPRPDLSALIGDWTDIYDRGQRARNADARKLTSRLLAANATALRHSGVRKFLLRVSDPLALAAACDHLAGANLRVFYGRLAQVSRGLATDMLREDGGLGIYWPHGVPLHLRDLEEDGLRRST
jgi:hypothetical protein